MPHANKTNRFGGETASKVLQASKAVFDLLPKNELKVCLGDVEVFPNEGYTWGKWEQNVIEFTKRRMICSIAWQWYPRREKFVVALPSFPGYDFRNYNNLKLMLFIKKALLDKCDVFVGHNIDAYDDPMIRTDLFLNKISPPPPHKTVDTLKAVKTLFRLNSNKLDDVCQELGIGKKVKHPGFSMWKGCMDGDMESWNQMCRYNVGDIDPLLRGLFEHLRPWMRNTPNMNLLDMNVGCPDCRSKNLAPQGYAFTKTGKTQRFKCIDCGSWSQGKKVGPKDMKVWRFTK